MKGEEERTAPSYLQWVGEALRGPARFSFMRSQLNSTLITRAYFFILVNKVQSESESTFAQVLWLSSLLEFHPEIITLS